MAYSKLSKSVLLEVAAPKGGVIFKGASTFDPEFDRYAVQCLKHKEYYRYFSASSGDIHELKSLIEVSAETLLRECPECTVERTPSRWPEGAEL